MGLILDTTILIASERRGEAVEDIVVRAQQVHGEDDIGISTISVVELTHGIYRARDFAAAERRREFVEDATALDVFPVSLEVARLAGRIEGEPAAIGIVIPVEDLLIGATALHLGYAMATLNTKHFQLIPGLKIVSL